MTRLVRCEQGDAARWDAYVRTHPDASAGHLFAWRRVLESAFGRPTAYLAAVEPAAAGGDDSVVGVLPLAETGTVTLGRELVSLPFLNQGGVVADSPGVEHALVAEAIALAGRRGARRLELRHAAARDLGLPARTHKAAFVRPLPKSAEALWRAFPAKLRSQVRRAEKAGIVAALAGPEALDDFYAVFAARMRDLGTPVLPRAFFAAVLRELPDATRLCVARLGGQPVAAGLLVSFARTVEIPWAAARPEHHALGPNMLLYWTALAHAADTGHERFDFGRSTPGSGTAAFKTQWGAVPVPLHWHVWRRDGRPEAPGPAGEGRVYRTARALWQRLPLPVANALGPRVAPRLPW